jgi:DNA replication protein DnaC
MLVTSNRPVGEWGTAFGDPVVATAILDGLLHHSDVVTIRVTTIGCAKSAGASLCRSPLRRPNP